LTNDFSAVEFFRQIFLTAGLFGGFCFTYSEIADRQQPCNRYFHVFPHNICIPPLSLFRKNALQVFLNNLLRVSFQKL